MFKQARAHTSAASKGATLVVISSLFYGSYGIWTKLMGSSFGSYTQSWLRGLLVVMYLLPIAIRHKQLQRIQWRRDAHWLFYLLLSGCIVAPALYFATLRIGIGLATLLSYAGIMLGMFLFGRLFSNERFTIDKLISTVMGLAGLGLVFTPNLQHFGIVALGAAFLGGLGIALDVAASQKIPYNASQTTILTWSASVVVGLPIAFILREPFPRVSADTHWLALLIFAGISLIASWSVIKGVKYIEAGAAGVLGLLEVVFGVLFGVVFFKEHLSVTSLIGMASILVAAAIPYVRHFKLKDEPFKL